MTKTLEDICTVITCGVAKRPDYYDDGIPFLSSKNVKEDRFLLNHYNFISKSDYELLTKHNKPKKGDILYTRVGSFGEAAVVDFDFDFAIFVSLTLIKPKKEILDSRYLMYYLNSPKIKDLASKSTSGVGVQNLNVGVVRKFPIDLPPLETQKHIAQILDDAVALRDKTRQLIKEYDALAQSIFLDMFGDPVRNQKCWKLENLKKITSKIGSGSTPSGGKDAYHEEGISLIRSLNIHDNFFKMKDLAFIDERQASKLKNVSLEKNDVLINITGASVARSTIVPDELLPARVNQHVSILRPKFSILNSVFLLHLLISPNSKAKLLGVSSQGGATREAITKDQLENFEIILPSIALQKQFAEKITLIEQQKELAKQELKESEHLFNCLLQKAFKGELK